MDTRRSERWKFKEIAKIQILEFFTKLNTRQTLCDKMCKYDSDYVHGQADGQSEISMHPVGGGGGWGVGVGGGGGWGGVGGGGLHGGYKGGIIKKKPSMNTESQTRINPLIMDIHNWLLGDHNSIMTINYGYL